MSNSPKSVRRCFELSPEHLDYLLFLTQAQQITENQLVAKALDILMNITDMLETQGNEIDFPSLSSETLQQIWGRNAPLPKPEERHIKMTYEDFLEWADPDMLTEWVDGEVIIASPSKDKGLVVREFIHNVLRIFVGVNKLGIMRVARFQMKLARSGREPDLLFVSTEHLDRLKATYLDGPADLVVEISSPESLPRDRGEKFYEYEQARIPEYWLLDPVRRWAEFYTLGPSGHYQIITAGTNGIAHSHVIRGFWLRIEWLWEPPQILQTLRELELITA